MEAIIIAGGLGTRLRPLVSDRPKALAPINGQPFLTLLLKMLAHRGFDRIILATGYKGEMIREAIGSAFAGMEIEYSNEEKPLGTGGAIASALKKCRHERPFALNGDTWLDMDYHSAHALAHKHCAMIMTGVYKEDAGRYGLLELGDNVVTGLGEKTSCQPGWINAGCYVLNRNIFAGYPSDGPFSFERDFLPQYLEHRPAVLYRTNSVFYDIGTPEDYKLFTAYIAQADKKTAGEQ